MKPIIIDMKDMSDSMEVYESRPNPAITAFVYCILALLIVALIWMGFFKIDIVVKGMGTVETAEEVGTVTNQVGGVIEKRMVEDGETVKKGDILYVVACEDAQLQLSALEEQYADAVQKEEMLSAYENWLSSGKEFASELQDNPYYNEIFARKNLLELGEEGTLQSYFGEMSAYDAKLAANAEMTDYYEDAAKKSQQLIEAIRSRKNTFPKEDSYYYNIMENYLTQYQQMINQYDVEVSSLQQKSLEAQKQIDNLEAQKQTLMKNLQGQNGSDTNESVSGGDITFVVANGTNQKELQKQLTQIEEQIAAQKEAKSTIESSITQCHTQKNSALSAFEKENIAAVESSLLGYEQNLSAYHGTWSEYVNGKETLADKGTETEISNLFMQERYSVATELDNTQKSKKQLAQQIQSLQQNVDNATVKATMSGKVNLNSSLVEGDYLAAGTQVLSIIPDTGEGTYVVKSYVENKDIAKIKEGMEVTYEIGAYPATEYGTMRGEVTFVSADLKVQNNGSAYYVVETSVDGEDLYNRLGEEATLKVGMLCETKIVVEKKSVLKVVLDKIF